jgi:hypothetical protein
VYVVNEAHHRSAVPRWREEWDSVFDINNDVGIAVGAKKTEWRAEILREPTAGCDHFVVAWSCRAAGQQRDVMATLAQAAREAVDDELGAAGLWVREIAPSNEDDAHRYAPTLGRRSATTSLSRSASR